MLKLRIMWPNMSHVMYQFAFFGPQFLAKPAHVGSVAYLCMLPLSFCDKYKISFFGVNTALVDNVFCPSIHCGKTAFCLAMPRPMKPATCFPKRLEFFYWLLKTEISLMDHQEPRNKQGEKERRRGKEAGFSSVKSSQACNGN